VPFVDCKLNRSVDSRWPLNAAPRIDTTGLNALVTTALQEFMRMSGGADISAFVIDLMIHVPSGVPFLDGGVTTERTFTLRSPLGSELERLVRAVVCLLKLHPACSYGFCCFDGRRVLPAYVTRIRDIPVPSAGLLLFCQIPVETGGFIAAQVL
jgi:hypothetical protein